MSADIETVAPEDEADHDAAAWLEWAERTAAEDIASMMADEAAALELESLAA